MFRNWNNVGTEGYISPGIIRKSKKSYKDADVWGLIMTLYDLVEDIVIFETSKQTKRGFKLEGRNGSTSFKNFISNVINDIFDDTFTHEKLMRSSWMKH